VNWRLTVGSELPVLAVIVAHYARDLGSREG
jgi:hypothetical protein